MKRVFVPLLVACGLVVSFHGLSGAEPESILVWHQTVGTERTGDGALVSPLHATGADPGTMTFALVSGEGDDHNASFTVTGDELRTAAALPENEYSIRLRAADDDGVSVEEVFTISVVAGWVEPKVAAGFFHTAVLAADGSVFTFGNGSHGQLGHGVDESRSIPVGIEHEALAEHTIVDIAANGQQTVLLSSDGTVLTFGRGTDGRLGHGDTDERNVPTPIEHDNLSGHRITRIAAGESHSVLLSSDGTVFTFGNGGNGRLGHGNAENRHVPTPIEHDNLAGSTITSIAAGGAHTLLRSAEGTVFTFGRGSEGALGLGDTADHLLPTRLDHENLSGKQIGTVAAGSRYSLLLASDGTVFAFGRGNAGQLGHGDTADRLVPTPILHDNLAGQTITGIAAGAAHTVLTSANGGMFTFGAGDFGRLGHGDSAGREVPTPVDHENLTGKAIREVTGGGAFTAAVDSGGSVFTFGWGSMGQLGHFDMEHRLVPTAIAFFRLPGHRMVRLEKSGGGGGTVLINGEAVSEFPHMAQAELGADLTLDAVPASGSIFEGWLDAPDETAASRTLNIENDKQVTVVFGREALILWNGTIGADRTGEGSLVGLLHAATAAGDAPDFALVSGDGDDNNTNFNVSGDELRTTGALPEGQYSVRVRATSRDGPPVEAVFTISVVPGRVESKLAAGWAHTVLLASDGTVYTFGSGSTGKLGHGDIEDRPVPTPLEHESLSGHTIVDAAAGSNHTVLLSSEGTVFTFGGGRSGQLGHGDEESRLVPTPIDHENLSGHRITRIAAGSGHTILLSSDGTVFTFGWGGNGRLGHGDTASRNAPTPIANGPLSGHAITEVSASAHSVLRSSEGAVFTFGPGGVGQLGHGETEDRLVPAEIDPENLAGDKIIRVAAGGAHTILLSSDEQVFTFGRGTEGQLGHGDTESWTAPTRIENESLSGHSIVEIAAGIRHSVLRAADGTVFTFGRGTSGELGHGDTSNRLEPVPIDSAGLTGLAVSGIASGSSHTVLLSSDGLVFTFGRGDYGRLGHGDTEDRLAPTGIQNINLSGRIVLELDIAGAGDGTLLLNGEAVSDPPHFLLADEGTVVVLDVVPEEDSFFAGWQGELTGTDTPRTLNLDAHKQVTAVFGLKSLVVWNQSIAPDRANPGALVSQLHASGRTHDPFTFSLVPGLGDDDNGNFLIDGRELRLADSLPLGEYSIRLRAESEGGQSVERVFSISVVLVESKIAAGGDHTIVLSPDGAAFTFGLGESGRLGHGDTEDRLFPEGIANETLSEHTIVDIAAGGSHSVLLSSEGTVFTFGKGAIGRSSVGLLGHGDTEDRLVPTPIEHENLAGHTIVRVAAGIAHTLLLSSDGTVFTFGSGGSGQLGHGDGESRLVPTPIEHDSLAGHAITGIAAGRNHSVLVSDDGVVFTFGSGRNGELGHGDTESRLVPTPIEHENLSDRTITGVAAGGRMGRISDSHTVLVATDGTVFTFGSGRFGQLGHGDTEDRLVPTQIEHEGLSGHTVSGARAGGLHTILWSEDGAVFTFGRGRSGQLGDGDVQDRLVPTRIEHDILTGHTITDAAAGGRHTVLLSSEGTVFTFGSGEFGRLGHGDTRLRQTPTPVPVFRLPGHQILRIRSLGDGDGAVSVDGETVSEFPFVTQFGAGTEVTLEAVPGEDSFFVRWRDDVSGTNPSQTLTLDEVRRGTVVFGSRSLVAWQQTIGADRTEAGALVSRLHAPHAADDSVTFALVPGEGDDDNANFSVAGDELRTPGALSVGEYSVRLRATSEDNGPPVEDAIAISVVPGTVEPKVAMGHSHTVFLSSDGTVFTFGSGDSGQLGHGDTEDRWVPIPIEHEALSGHTIVDVAAGWAHSVLLALDGTVFTFGRGTSGQLGHGDTDSRLAPTPIAPGALDGRAITGISAGASHTVLRSADGTIFTFGSGSSGQLGHGDTEGRLVPTPIASEKLAGYTITSLSAGAEDIRSRFGGNGNTFLLSRNGTVISFGAGALGQLGHGDRDDRLVPTPVESEVLAGHTIDGVALGGQHTVLLSSDGTVFTFGPGYNGLLGHGDERERLVPTPIDEENLSGQAITQVAAGRQHTVLLSEDGTVFSFGRGIWGQMGHGDTEPRLVPTPIEHENLTGRSITGAFAGTDHTALLSADGTVLTFGSGRSGQLGHGDTEDRLVPTPIEFFRLPGYRMYAVDFAGDGVGAVFVDGEPVAEFPFMNQAETGTEVLIEAIPGEDSVFSRWTGDLSETESSFQLKLDADVRFTAVINLREDLRFQNAMADAGLSGENAEPDAAPFGDGVSNLLKYAFNMDASGTDRRSLMRGEGGRRGLPAVAPGNGAEPVLVIEFVRRRNSGLIYTPRVSTDLDNWEPVTEEPSVNVIDSDWERVVVEVPLDAPAPRAFGSVRVTLP